MISIPLGPGITTTASGGSVHLEVRLAGGRPGYTYLSPASARELAALLLTLADIAASQPPPLVAGGPPEEE